jgi:hypothetical protein
MRAVVGFDLAGLGRDRRRPSRRADQFTGRLTGKCERMQRLQEEVCDAWTQQRRNNGATTAKSRRKRDACTTS